jgi:hypothetical protein
MTAIFARQPLHPLSMSSSQRVPRRLSARLQEKEDAHPTTNGFYSATSGTTTAASKSIQEKDAMSKKRKIGEQNQSTTCRVAGIASNF